MSNQTPTPTAPVAAIKSTAHRYTCEQIGVCQRRSPGCSGCAPFVSSQAVHPFAPGVIEKQEPIGLLGDKGQRHYLVKYAAISAALVIAVVLVSGLAGYWMAQ
jgi:hypothetical protein